MKAVILAGGKGSRITEESVFLPKPLIEVGGQPMLWHILKIYSHYGINDFVICLGYKGYKIKEYFYNYSLHHASAITLETRTKNIQIHRSTLEDWRITLVDTGEETMTGGRLKRVRSYLEEDEPFCLTYGDGVGNVDIAASIQFHQSHGKRATITAVHPMARFGSLDIDGTQVKHFVEKPMGEGGLINGGFFVLSPEVIDYIEGDETLWEKEPLERLAEEGQLMAYQHHGFWQPMDTMRDRLALEQAWAQGNAPWKVWE